MDKKIKLYEDLYYSDEFEHGKFPFVIMISDTRYEINSDEVTVFQVTSINEFMNNISKKERKVSQPKGIKIKVG